MYFLFYSQFIMLIFLKWQRWLHFLITFIFFCAKTAVYFKITFISETCVHVNSCDTSPQFLAGQKNKNCGLVYTGQRITRASKCAVIQEALQDWEKLIPESDYTQETGVPLPSSLPAAASFTATTHAALLGFGELFADPAHEVGHTAGESVQCLVHRKHIAPAESFCRHLTLNRQP